VTAELVKLTDNPPMPRINTVPVSEVFPAWQGEGPATGQACTFLRLGLCNLHCSWCDTPFTWDRTRYDVAAECPPRTADWIVDKVTDHPARLIVLSGGEPLMHRGNRALLAALDELVQFHGRELHVETNGTLVPSTELLDMTGLFVVSPKIAQTDDPISKRIKPGVLTYFAALALQDQAIFKFVARHEDDVHAISRLVRDIGIPARCVWVMPEGTNALDLIATHRAIAPLLEQTGFNPSSRLHVLLYGNQKGK
jgi:organic radical activating enzyme